MIKGEKMNTGISKAKKIGILGGTFDPIHVGHLILAEQARDQYRLDKVLLIPSGHSYFKDHRQQKVQPAESRLKMTKIAAEGYAPFEVSDIEVLRPGNTYTFETLEEIRRRNPEAELFFIVGADTVCAMDTWREPARIFAACTILAAMREDQVDPDKLRADAETLRKKYDAKILPVTIPAIGISSTDIRKRIGAGKSIHYLVPDRLERYIIENGIYR